MFLQLEGREGRGRGCLPAAGFMKARGRGDKGTDERSQTPSSKDLNVSKGQLGYRCKGPPQGRFADEDEDEKRRECR